MNNSPKANQILGKFNSLRNAESFSDRSFATTGKANAIILGDDEKFWVTNLRTFENLTANGYEEAI